MNVVQMPFVSQLTHPTLETVPPGCNTVFPVLGGAVFSTDQRYRYRLWRRWVDGPEVLWVMLNPSTADAQEDDPTITRCVGFSKAWGFGGLQVVNLYALRATKPEELLGHPDPEGPDNAAAWDDAGWRSEGRTVVAAWGEKVNMPGLPRSLMHPGRVAREFQCLGVTRDGHPRHPLYVPNAASLRPWVGSLRASPGHPEEQRILKMDEVACHPLVLNQPPNSSGAELWAVGSD